MIHLLFVMALLQAGIHQPEQPAQIVFVCEHGAAKSVIASAYFNKLAAERGLPYRSTYRGMTPQEELSTKAVAGLKADGLPVPSTRPSAATQHDVDRAKHVFTIGCKLPDGVKAQAKTKDWSDVPDMSAGYAAVRDAIRTHVDQLIAALQK